MRLFRRDDITIVCLVRGATLVVPDEGRLLDACPPEHHRRLRRVLEKAEADGWTVEWRKPVGAELQARDVVAVLRCAESVVELAYGQRGVLTEVLTVESGQVLPGTRLARVARVPPKAESVEPPPEQPHSINELLRHFVARQRSDAETIKRLESDLAEYRQMAERLNSEVFQLRAGSPATRNRPTTNSKIKRLKHEFSKRFHPDGRPADDAERAFREQVFREFWPILDEIDRS